jgi:3-deoxy-D-manno-octulosonic-acid transferase
VRVIFFVYQIFSLPIYFIAKIVASSRFKFEYQNKNDPACLSFKENNKQADVAFEVSSEGEFQQVKPLIDYCLEQNKFVELIFCSSSVEKQIMNYQKKHAENMRILRLPLASYLPFGKNNLKSWMSSKVLILCRYDFFPELVYLGKFFCEKFILVNGTLKNYKSNFWLNGVYQSFDFILTPTGNDKKRFEEIFQKHEVFEHDFRTIEIAKRIQGSESHLENNIEQWPKVKAFIESFDISARYIYGSFWANEAQLFANGDFIKSIKTGASFNAIFPHKLGQDDILGQVDAIKQAAHIPVYVYAGHDWDLIESKYKQNPGVIIFQLKGVLVEIYRYFAHCYVGGGFGRSVHSLLEPYLAGCRLYCGPKVHRSTEYDLILDKDEQQINIMESLESFYSLTLSHDLDLKGQVREDYIRQVNHDFPKIIASLELN